MITDATGLEAGSTERALSTTAFRARFPVLERVVHLSTCSLAARSLDLDLAMNRMVEDMARGGGAWVQFEEQVRRARLGFAALIGADVDQIALVPNASVGAYQAASTMDWRGRPKIVTASREFPSIAHVWLAQRPRGAHVVYADDATHYAELIDRRTKLVSVPLITYQDAHRLPVAEIARVAHSAGAMVLVDAYQAVGVHPVSVHELACDFLVAGCMKYLLGLPGLAFLYARSPLLADRNPRLTGWFGRVDPFAFDVARLDFPDTAARYETGTPAIPACYAANAGLGLVGALDLERVRAHVLRLTERAVERLTEQGERICAAPTGQRGAHVGLADPDPAALTRWLAGRDISVSPRGRIVRVSLHHYSTADDIDALCAAVADYRRMHRNRRRVER